MKNATNDSNEHMTKLGNTCHTVNKMHNKDIQVSNPQLTATSAYDKTLP